MTLEEAIKHCKEIICNSIECKQEHKQLAEWLEELQEYRKIYPQVIGGITND